ncbi:glycosyltransferase family protein [Aquipuribacter sp. SD81]|uniref:glycosyltransferase family protein n=1 Tax=Aquipuribacter sp. SD81 TaxID=3127703 RepID=UPI00301B4889
MHDAGPPTAPRRPLRVATLLDPWLRAAIDPECRQVPVSARRWRLPARRPDLLLVQATAVRGAPWSRGPAGSQEPAPALRRLVRGHAADGVPTVLWLTDPDGWRHDLATARLFGTVLTVDPASTAELAESLGHERVHVMAMAVQPRTVNPLVAPVPAARRAVLLGAALADDVEGPDEWLATLVGARKDNRPQLVSVVQDDAAGPVADPGPDVLHAAVAAGKPAVDPAADLAPDPGAGPERLHGLRHASVPAHRLPGVYRAHEVVLARGGPGLPDLALRAAVEASAASVAVAVPDAAALEAQHAGRLTLVPAGEAGADALRALLGSPELRDRLAHRAMRHVLAHHTWAHRVDQLARLHGLPVTERRRCVTVVVPATRGHRLARVLQQVGAQTHRDVELVVLDRGAGLDPADLVARARRAGLAPPALVPSSTAEALPDALHRAADHLTGDLVAVLDELGHYAPRYLADQVAAAQWAPGAVLGKRAHYVHLEATGATVLRHPGEEHRTVEALEPGTLLLPRALLADLVAPPAEPGADAATTRDEPAADLVGRARAAGVDLVATDRFSFLRRRETDGLRPELLPGTSLVQFYGPAEAHVDV